ncbi:P-loop containing nucleoside triphosphate hydrolase [Vibrio phage 2.275.O._10N.286.54.E11]|nr:P-loop containing nucleoside triphosphate hydrolase [Vibrio phage 2.275.O._10N.286.54.E11]
MTKEFKLTLDQQGIHRAITTQVNTHVGRFDCNIQGPAGTGKSTLISRIIKDLSFGFTVGVTSPTHKANRVLDTMLTEAGVEMSNCDVMTIHSFLGLKLVWKKDKQVLEIDRNSPNAKKRVDVLIIDECSMISQDMYQHIVSQSGRVRRAIIFLGDSCQLPPVEPEKAQTNLSVTFQHGVKYELTEVLRQALDNPIIKLATEIRQCIGQKTNPQQYLSNIDDLGTIIGVNDDEFYLTYLDFVQADTVEDVTENIQNHKILAYTNAKVDEWNSVIRMTIFPDEEEEFFVGEPIVIESPSGKCPFGTQELISCPSVKKTCWFGIDCWEMRSDGQVFLVVGPKSKIEYENKLKEIVDSINTGKINKLTKRPHTWADYYIIKEKITTAIYPYATTFHKSQGSTFDNIWLDLHYVSMVRDYDDKSRMLYTACTRPKHNIIINNKQ